MDNARYHSSNTCPKQNDKKHTLYAWLQQQALTDDTICLVEEKNMRKFELWDIIKGLKEKNNYYEIDRLAREYNQQVSHSEYLQTN